MESKYDSYYEEDIPYKMTMEELYERAKPRDGYMTERDILAYIRYRGEKVRFMVPCAPPAAIIDLSGLFGFGMAMVDGNQHVHTVCKLVTTGERHSDSSYNPLVEGSVIPREGSWYCAYKLGITPVGYRGVIDDWYVSDFCGAINRGSISILEIDDEALMAEESCGQEA